jgi:phosphomevalonate kinase
LSIQVTTPGKLILIGEFAVLEGAPALVMAVNRYTRISVKRRQDPYYTVQSPTLQIKDFHFKISPDGSIVFPAETSSYDLKNLNFFIHTLEFLLKMEKITEKIPALDIVLDTQEFYSQKSLQKYGLGSSAALTVALVQGLLAQWNPNDARISDPLKLFKLTQEIHYEAQGKQGSGIDIAASCFGGFIHFVRKNIGHTPSFTINSVDLPDNLIILPVWTGTSASTTKLVNQVNDLKNSNVNRFKKIIQNLSNISHLACKAFSKQETQTFLGCCDEYYQKLKELGESSQANIISGVHQKVQSIAKASGAVYKPSGAGGGDLGMVFTDSREIEKMVSDNLLRSGFEILNLSPSFRGSDVELVDFSKGGF